MNIFNKKILAVFALSFILFFTGASFANAIGPCGACVTTNDCDISSDGSRMPCENGKCRGCAAGGNITICNPLKACEIQEVIDSVINFIFYISLVIAPLMIIIAAVYLLTSAGDPKKVTTAKDIILYTSIGLLIVLLAKGLIAILKQVLGGS